MHLSSSQKKVHVRSFIITVLICFSGLMVGLDLGVISGALSFIAQTFKASTLALEWIVGIMLAGAAVGSILAGYWAKQLGRKKLLVITAILLFLGSGGCAIAWSVFSLLIGRFVMGVGLGIAAFAAPVYISELIMEEIRGLMGTFFQLMITIGILLSYLSNYFLSGLDNNWRWMFAIALIPATLSLISVFFLPSDPRWLITRGREEEALKTLKYLRYTDAAAHKDIEGIKTDIKTQTTAQNGFSLFKNNVHFRRAVFLGITLQAMQQLAGINAIINYAPTIFKLAGFGADSQLTNTILVGVINILSTFIAMALIEKWGRKPILYIGFSIMMVSMAVLALSISTGNGSSFVQTLSVAMLLLFIIGFAMSIGPLAWVICSEIQPSNGRDFGVSLSTLSNWISNMLVSASFLSLLELIGYGGTFWIFAGLNGLFIILTFMFVPETKGVALKDLEQNLMKGIQLRKIGR
ncbi:sugar porter family MFS transporter [Entomobacter blattae]|nr:sugar porter family MFS transporter [Entomobacter blattae]